MNDRFLFSLVEHIGHFIVSLIGLTLRVKRIGFENFKEMEQRGSFLFTTFHGRMFVPVWLHRKTGITALISQSRDGELVTRLVKGLGYNSIRGSSTRGGRKALREMIALLNSGGVVAHLVDGPKGPNEVPKIGTIVTAKLANVPILPLAGSCSTSKTFNSWDRFQLPLPFSRAVVVYGEPFVVPSEAKGEELENCRLELEKIMKQLREQADKLADE